MALISTPWTLEVTMIKGNVQRQLKKRDLILPLFGGKRNCRRASHNTAGRSDLQLETNTHNTPADSDCKY